MKPIIDPSTIYWIERLDIFNGVIIFLGVCLLIGAVIAFVASYAEKPWSAPNDAKQVVIAKYFNLGKWLLILTAILALTLCFIPTTATGYKMLLAKYATPNNIEAVKKEIINIEYGVKQDVIDIIKAAKPDEKGEKK